MNILFCASEAAPFAASGGLGDVAGSLPRAIRNRKVACRVVMPLYGDMKQEYREKLTYITNFTVPVGWRNQYCGLFELTHNGVKYYFLDNEYYFKRTGLYGFYDDGERFAFFSRAILEMLFHVDFVPDVIPRQRLADGAGARISEPVLPTSGAVPQHQNRVHDP